MRFGWLVALVGLVSTSPLARAEPLLQPPSPAPAPNDDEPPPPLVPPAKDTLGGHLVGAASGAFVFPWGDLSERVPASDLGPGYGVSLDLGYGLSRSVVIGAWGQYSTYANSPDCGTDPNPDAGCTASGFAVGPFVRYHLVQGMRFDPWILAGIGYRAMSVDSSSGTDDYSGFEWMKISLGGDYYPFKNFGFGPVIEFAAGTFGTRPSDEGESRAHFSFVLGLRLILDVPGK
jgi:hypothetical protein